MTPITNTARAWGIVVLTTIVAAGCARDADPPAEAVVTALELPAAAGSRFPDISQTPDGRLLVSWLETADEDSARLVFSLGDDDGWQSPVSVATGHDWFVNWADFPSVRALDNGIWAAHWLVRRPEGGYAYDVAVAISADSGRSWGARVTPYRDTSATEHGFVTLFGDTPGQVDLVWLDGRNSEGPDGEMQLISGSLAPDGRLLAEQVVDERVCDCCQTDATRLDDGWLVAYRDRSADEIRDIRLALNSPAGWQQLGKPADDGFEFSACPVNGPAVAAAQNDVIVVWWLLENRQPVVRAARSVNGGKSFGRMRDLARGSLPGRVDALMLGNGNAAVTWMERNEDVATIRLQILDANLEERRTVDVAKTPRSRESGFPRMALSGNDIVVVWTDPEIGTVRGARVTL